MQCNSSTTYEFTWVKLHRGDVREHLGRKGSSTALWRIS